MAPVFRDVDERFFKKWTPEMAYVLGYFAADGSMIQNKRGAHFIEFTSTDKVLIENVRYFLKSEHHISVREGKNAHQNTMFRLQIGSKQMFSDLADLGFSQNKSKSLAFPRVPVHMLSHFIRGYFDGDGNVYFKEHFSKEKGHPIWVFTSGFTSGSLVFLEMLHTTLKEYGIIGGSIKTKQKQSGHELVLSRKDSVALWRFMYNNAPARMYLLRKRKIFERAIRTLRMRV